MKVILLWRVKDIYGCPFLFSYNISVILDHHLYCYPHIYIYINNTLRYIYVLLNRVIWICCTHYNFRYNYVLSDKTTYFQTFTPSRYNWNIVESDIKHHHIKETNKQTNQTFTNENQLFNYVQYSKLSSLQKLIVKRINIVVRGDPGLL